MKRILNLAATVCFLVPLVVGGQVSSGVAQSVERQIEPLLKQMTAAANSHDTDRFLATYLHDSTLVLVFNGEVIVGIDSVRKLQLKWWNNGKSAVVYAQSGRSRFTVLGPDAAVEAGAMVSSRTLAGGRKSTSRFAVMNVWQKRPEGWRIVQVHESTVPTLSPGATPRK